MKAIIKSAILILSVFTFFNVNAQFITLPDANFASFIAATYPSAVNGSNQLDTNMAKTFTGAFICEYKNVSNVFGLQYFEGIDYIELTGNNLTTIPDISKIINLNFLELDSNQITSLPPLNTLTNLQRLRIRYNPITTLPSLAGLSNVFQIFIDHNQLTSLPDLTGLTSLDHFIISDNNISTLPDMSTLTSLRRFLASNNDFTSVDLTPLIALEEVRFNFNSLTAFPNVAGMTQLKELWLDENKISALPNLSAFTNFIDFKINRNFLTFEDLIPLTTHPDLASFTLAPQLAIILSDTLTFKVGDSLVWNTQIDPSLTNNTYSWYKNGVFITSTTTNVFKIDSLVLSDNALYTVQVQNSNPALAGITLTSTPLKVVVMSCFDASQVEINFPVNNCTFPIAGILDESTIFGGVAPYSYKVKNSINGNEITFTSANLNIPQQGYYDLEIKDNIGCTVNLQKKINIQRNPHCDPIIYPDSPGPESSYYIENTGKALVYNKEGKVVKELSLPAYWDGTDKNGSVVDSGLYMIIINEHVKVAISVMRRN
ncbi:MAG: hypothetical protein K2X86_05775 [Cytophagaceae bacterium]|nr:hypothetical protein [Cytophagaceae bacterium]